MESKLFSYFDVTEDKNKNFEKDFKHFLKYSNEIKRTLTEKYIDYYNKYVPKEKIKLIDETSVDMKITIVDVQRSFAIISFFLKNIIDEDTIDDTPEKWVEDLKDLKLLKENEKKDLLIFLTYIWDIAKDRYKQIRDKDSWGKGVLPSFKGLNHSIEFRGVFSKKYHLGEDSSEYNPEVINIIPIISISIWSVNDIDEREILNFNATIEDVGIIINHLQAALKEMDAFHDWQMGIQKT